MKLQDITLSKLSQSQKDKFCVIPLLWDSKTVKLVEAESRMVAKGKGGIAIRCKVSVMQDEYILEICCTTLCLIISNTVLYVQLKIC